MTPGTPLLIALPFEDGLADRKSAFTILNGNNWATLCTNLVSIRSTISEFTLLKRAILKALYAQIMDLYLIFQFVNGHCHCNQIMLP